MTIDRPKLPAVREALDRRFPFSVELPVHTYEVGSIVLGRSEGWQRQLDRIPMGRAASDEEVAGLIAFLCSPAAAFMTGQSVNIDGCVVMW